MHLGNRPIENLIKLQELVDQTDFPAGKVAIFKKAKMERIDMNTLTLIQSLPDVTFNNKKEVFNSIGLSDNFIH